MKSRLFRFVVLALAAWALSGCASTYLLDSNVQAFSSLPALPQPSTYRFERLPSQQADPAQADLETLADPALHQAGLKRDDASPRLSVQVGGRVERILSPWSDPWDPWGWGGWGAGGRGWGLWGPFPRMEQAWYQREVHVVVRDLASNRVVFESRATNQGPFLDPRTVLPAMFQAALQGFPNPPPGPRRVDIQLGAAKPAS